MEIFIQISFKLVKPFGHNKKICILHLPIPYCVSLIMVTITSHIFINIFQTVHFSAVKFTRGNEKNMSFLLIPKSPTVWKKSEAIGPGIFKCLWDNGSLAAHIIQLGFVCCKIFLFKKICVCGHHLKYIYICILIEW